MKTLSLKYYKSRFIQILPLTSTAMGTKHFTVFSPICPLEEEDNYHLTGQWRKIKVIEKVSLSLAHEAVS